MKKLKNNGGFTLLEILIVVVLFSMIAIFAGWMITTLVWLIGAALWFAFQFLPLLLLVGLMAATWFGVCRLFDKA